MVNMHAQTLLLTLALSLCACAAKSPYADEPLYSSGYSAGCASAGSGAGGSRVIPGRITRDEALYKSDKAYRAGWNAGFHACAPPPDDAMSGGRF
jgi:hypothetical protein